MNRIIVLGGEGQIGKPLCSFLIENNIKVYNIDLVLGKQHDLREKCELLNYWMPAVDGVVFLAYDIGGAKFLQTKQNDFNFLQNNTKIMSNVFDCLNIHNKPFVFISSAMANMTWTSYGNLKRLGEYFTKSLGGINVRLWNVYGPEENNIKSHVITDLIWKAKNNKVIDLMTDGTEVRQFLHVEDCSQALLSLLQNYSETSKYEKFDLSSFVWTDIRTVANIIAEYYNVDVVISSKKDTVQLNTRIEPDLYPIQKYWDPNKSLDIKTGIFKIIKTYEERGI